MVIRNFLFKTRVFGLFAVSLVLALATLSGVTSVHGMEMQMSASQNAKMEKVMTSAKLKIDALSLEHTLIVWSRYEKLMKRIPSTYKHYDLIEWLGEYIQWSVTHKQSMNSMNTIADLAMANDDLSMLVDIVVFLDMAASLKADGQWTVFAPTNEAFAQLLQDLDMTAEEIMQDKELLKQIVLHHVVDMKVTAKDVMELWYGSLVDTASWETIRVRTSADGVWIDDAMVIDADMIASNGIVHVVDKVLLPPSLVKERNWPSDRGDMNIAEIAMGNDMFTTLVAGVQAADWADMLMEEGPWTVFAPTNDAFQKLLNENNMTAAQLLADKEMLKEVLSYHVVAGFYTSSDIMGLDNAVMWKTQNGASVRIDPAWMVDSATIINADIYATNGVVHVIDEVLMP